MKVEKVLGRTRDGGSCANCGGDYVGRPLSPRGYRVLAHVAPQTDPGVVEPMNLCPDCFDQMEVEA